MVMFPDGSADDDDRQSAALGALTPAQPTLPSRATGQEKPVTPLPQTEDPEPRKPRTRRAPPAPKRVVRKATRKPRRKTVAKKPKKTVKRGVPAAKRGVPAASRNRPLEAKNRLHAVMSVVAEMAKGETTAFMGCMSMLEDMTGPAQRKVIEALGRVYV